MTLNGIIKKILKPIADDHLMINDFGFGDLANYATTDQIKYPIMWVVVKPLRYAEKAYNYNFSIVFADKVQDDLSNNLEIQSDMIQVAADVATKIANYDDDDIEIEPDFNLNPFTERFTDLCSGVVLELTIKASKVLSPCEFPSRFDISTNNLLTENSEPLDTESGSDLDV